MGVTGGGKAEPLREDLCPLPQALSQEARQLGRWGEPGCARCFVKGLADLDLEERGTSHAGTIRAGSAAES